MTRSESCTLWYFGAVTEASIVDGLLLTTAPTTFITPGLVDFSKLIKSDWSGQLFSFSYQNALIVAHFASLTNIPQYDNC